MCKNTAGSRIKAERPTQCRSFGECSLGKLADDSLLYRKTVFNDEAYFWLNEYVNKENCGFQSEDQPEALEKLPMHPEKGTDGAVYRRMASLDGTSSKMLRIVT